jgi:hypothetical protein
LSSVLPNKATDEREGGPSFSDEKNISSLNSNILRTTFAFAKPEKAEVLVV